MKIKINRESWSPVYVPTFGGVREFEVPEAKVREWVAVGIAFDGCQREMAALIRDAGRKAREKKL